MEAYKLETEEIVTLFLQGRLDLSECTSALNSSFRDVFARLDGKQLDSLRVLLMSLADTLAKEMEEQEERRTLDS